MPATAVSVALCTYNGARYIEQQLESVLQQTAPPVEVVISDDGSTDATLAVVRAVVARRGAGTNIRIIENARPLGIARNFEQAVAACGSGLIALCDQDDVWQPERLEVMVREFDARPDLAVLFTDARLVNAAGAPLGSLFAALEISRADLATFGTDAAFATLLRRNLATGATMLFRRGVLTAALPFPDTWIHDEWIVAVAAATATVDWLPDQLVDYRQHGRNQIGASRPSLRRKVRKATEPRDGRYVHLAQRSTDLLTRLEETGAPGPVLELARAKAAHASFRSHLPRNRLLRVVPVLRADCAGAYAAYSPRGRADIIRDLLQPAGALPNSPGDEGRTL